MSALEAIGRHLAVAEALPTEGRLVTCDISEEWTAIARRYWREVGMPE